MACVALGLAAGCERGSTEPAASGGTAALPEPPPPGVVPAPPLASPPPGASDAAAPPGAPAAAEPSSASTERGPRVVESSVGGRDATSPGGSVVAGLIVDTLVDIAPAGPATATERGVAMVNRANELWLAPLALPARGGPRPRATPLRSLPASAGPFALAKGPAVRGGYAYWVSRGRLLRRSLASAGPGTVPEQLREDARVGTRVAVPIGASKELASLPPLAAYVARAPTPDAPLSAKLLDAIGTLLREPVPPIGYSRPERLAQ